LIVPAVAVADKPAPVLKEQFTMPPTAFGLRQNDIVLGIPTDGEMLGRQRPGLAVNGDEGSDLCFIVDSFANIQHYFFRCLMRKCFVFEKRL
jgi:hypothetical protein